MINGSGQRGNLKLILTHLPLKRKSAIRSTVYEPQNQKIKQLTNLIKLVKYLHFTKNYTVYM